MGPIFVGGLSFSGKTQLRLMLISHPNIVITRRTYMWTRFYGRFGDLSQPENFKRCLEAMLRFKHMHVLNPDPDRISREFWQGPPSYERLFALFHEHNAERLGKPRWGDQLGHVEQYADPIFSAYPSARMIHMIRDPRERYKVHISSSRYRRAKVGWETAEWRHSAGLARRNRQRYPDRYKILQYERLLCHPEETLREVCSFLEEDFFPAMVSVDGVPGPGKVKEKKSDATPELAASKRDAESQIVSEREIALIQAFIKREMSVLGYSLKPIRLSPRDRLLFVLVDGPVNLASMALWHGQRKSLRG